MKWKVITIYSLVMLTLVVFLPLGSTGAVDTVEVDLVTKPTEVLFDVSNIKPGDVFERTFDIKNGGNVDLRYKTKAEFLSGSEKLYNQLILHVTDGKTTLYEGSLHKFSGFDERQLTYSDSDQLIYKVEFPYESGNEFQGLATRFQIIISADYLAMSSNGTDDGKSDFLGMKLPATAMSKPFVLFFVGLTIMTVGLWVYYRQRKTFQ